DVHTGQRQHAVRLGAVLGAGVEDDGGRRCGHGVQLRSAGLGCRLPERRQGRGAFAHCVFPPGFWPGWAWLSPPPPTAGRVFGTGLSCGASCSPSLCSERRSVPIWSARNSFCASSGVTASVTVLASGCGLLLFLAATPSSLRCATA